MKFILGKKIKMSQMFDKDGNVTPVTLVQAGPCYVLQKKSQEKEGYDAVQIGFGKITKARSIKKSMKGKEYQYIKEAPVGKDATVAPGDQINVSAFAEGDMVTVIGISKGKGFQGAVKRHGFHGRDRTHGQKHDQRTVGSIGHRFPQHTIKGQRMPGRMGYDQVTVKNLKIEKVDVEHHVLAIRGAVPGHRGTLLAIRG